MSGLTGSITYDQRMVVSEACPITGLTRKVCIKGRGARVLFTGTSLVI